MTLIVPLKLFAFIFRLFPSSWSTSTSPSQFCSVPFCSTPVRMLEERVEMSAKRENLRKYSGGA